MEVLSDILFSVDYFRNSGVATVAVFILDKKRMQLWMGKYLKNALLSHCVLHLLSVVLPPNVVLFVPLVFISLSSSATGQLKRKRNNWFNLFCFALVALCAP